MQLDQQISELLYHYDCVIIPEFGGFVTNYKPAHLDQRLHLFHPPSKEVSFNKNLKRNDGLLAHYLAEVDECTFEEANETIKKSVEDYFARLNNGERVVFGKVGIIYRDAHKNLRFQPSREENFLKDSFGLEKLFTVPAEKPVEQPAVVSNEPAQKPAQDTPIIPIKSKPLKKEAEQEKAISGDKNFASLKWAAVLMLPMMAYAGWLISTADISRPADLTIADLNPFKGKSSMVYSERQVDDTDLLHSEEISDTVEEKLSSDESVVKVSFTDPENGGVWVKLKEASFSPPVSTYTATADILAMRYHVVGGCFGELKNARGMVDDLRSRGYKAYIHDYHKGLYRVTFADFHRRDDALVALRKIKSEEMNAAWLLVQ